MRQRPWPDDVRVAAADEAEQRVSNLSRAYRVNLSVLALVALLVGAFLVYSVLALSVAQRTPTFALLGVLGLTARERRAWVLAEAACIGAFGSVLGLAAGAGAGLAGAARARRRPRRRLLSGHRACACSSVCGQRCCTAHSASLPPWAAPGGRRVRPNGWHRRRR